MNQLNRFLKVNFACDKCGGEFQHDTAYSLAPSLDQAEGYSTYCVNCVRVEKEKTKTKNKTKKPKSWGTAPINEISDNTQSLNLDKRTLKKTGRVHLFATRVKKEWIEQLKSIAYEERKHYNEVLEKALECYERERKK